MRLTEDTGVRHENLTDFEFPTLDYIESLTQAQKRTLHITGASSTVGNGRCNIFLSTGEQSKVADWQDQTVAMI
jgi:hypothetical protein